MWQSKLLENSYTKAKLILNEVIIFLYCSKSFGELNTRYVIRVSALTGLGTWRKFCIRFSQAKISTWYWPTRSPKWPVKCYRHHHHKWYLKSALRRNDSQSAFSVPRGHSFPFGIIPLPTFHPEINLNIFRRLRIGSRFELLACPTWRDVPFSFPLWQVGLLGMLLTVLEIQTAGLLWGARYVLFSKEKYNVSS